MAATTSLITKADLSNMNMFNQIALFYPDMLMYQTVRIGKPVTITDGNDVTRTGTVQQKNFGPLVSVINQFGPQYPSMYGKMYDVTSVVDDLVDQFPDKDAADARTFYTVLVVALDPITPPMPAVVSMAPNVVPLNQMAA